MASILPGYEYDIFISYRHNDNRGSWVTEFVKALQEELAATIKEPVSVYFDSSPHDGLLETHNVDKSLEGKLKCLIFIPILSQTYCDPKSFAWQHEFVAFNRLARQDPFGRDIKLSNGNVASRILPIKIHDLDAEDKVIIENEIGGVLRAIEFIYKEAGVNRPLLSTDNPDKNIGKTSYRNQVNKVANAIKEIISRIKNPVSPKPKTNNYQPSSAKASVGRPKFIFAAAIIILLISAGYFLYSKFVPAFKPIETIDKSVAVLPFIDLSEAKDQGWFSDGLTEEILNSLAHINGLKVISRTSSFAFKNKNLRIETIADSLHVNYIVEGSVRKSDQGFRITAQLIRANDGFHIWSNSYDRSSKDIFVLQQEIATKIAQSLDISLDPKALKKMQWAGTENAEAYLAFLKGKEWYDKGHNKRSELLYYLGKANSLFEESSKLDPEFTNPYLYHADLYLHYLLLDNKLADDTLSVDIALGKMKDDLNFAVTNAKTEATKDYYRLYQIMYSNDWSGFRPAIEKVLTNPEATKLFTYQSFALGRLLAFLGYEGEIIEVEKRILENDPLNWEALRDLTSALFSLDKYQEALQILNQTNLNNNDIVFLKLFALYKLERDTEAEALLTQLDSSFIYFNDVKLLLLVKRESNVPATQRTPYKDKLRSIYSLYAVNKVFGSAAANAKASRLDKKVLLAFPLFDMSFGRPPLDLTVTPNLARRLKLAGARTNQNK